MSVSSSSPSDPDLDLAALLEEEGLIIRFGGEIPEIAFHSSLYYLCQDPEGPGLVLDEADLVPLRQAVVERYREIILRDLDPDNRDKSLYRGLARSLANWRRLKTFRRRQHLPADPELRTEVAAALCSFLAQEHAEVSGGQRRSCVNCSAGDLQAFTEELGLDPAGLPPGWQGLCRAEGEG